VSRIKSGAQAREAPDVRIGEAGFCALDLETTGLSSFSRMVEVGAVRFKVGEEGECFQTLVDPGCSIPHGARRVHGITDEMVSGAPRAQEVLEQLLEFASGCVLLAHNARYDVSIMTTELVRAGMDLPPNEVLCTIKVSKRFLPRMPNYRLQTVAGLLEIDPGGFHRALSDAVAAKQIFEKAVTAERGWEERSLSHLLEQCSSARMGTNIDVDARVPSELEEVRRSISEAIDCGARMTILYGAGARGPWPTQVKPLCVFSVKSGHYLEASCKDGLTRSFRLDRIARIISIELGE
jgi:DNA polymerase III epsilon subunit family exonuclease